MSKAFTDEEVPVQEVYFQPRDLQTGTDNYITRPGYENLQSQMAQLTAEFEFLSGTGKATDEVRAREIEHRLQILKSRLESAVIVDPPAMAGQVVFGSTVTVRDEDEKEHRYQLVGIDETDAKNGRISWISPVGKALLRARVGDYVIVKTPRGEEELEITAIA